MNEESDVTETPHAEHPTPPAGSRWAVILGISGGTGAAVAEAVSKDPGLNIFGVHRGRYQDRADELVEKLQATGRQVVMRVGEAGTAESAQRGVAQLLEVAGPGSVHLFVHSLASASVGNFASEEPFFHPKQVDKTFNVMAHSFVYWIQAMHRRQLLVADGARLLGLTNPLDDTLLHNTGLISASKAALEVYVRHLAMELGPLGHRVNLLKFGTVMTPALQHVYTPAALDALRINHERMIPAGRMCTTEEVGRFISILCGEGVDWFNGSLIDFSGGMTLRLLDLVLNAKDSSLS